MASGKSSSVTLQSLLPDRAYKVIVSAIHYTGESESTSTTGRTGKCISQHVYVLHNLPSISLEATSVEAAMSSLALGCGQGQGFAQQGRLPALKRQNPASNSALLPCIIRDSRMTRKGW